TLPLLTLGSSQAAVTTADDARAAQAQWREIFARGLFGELPPAPSRLDWARQTLADAHCERIAIRLEVDGRSLAVDAALWLPPNVTGQVPVIVGLDFLGPLGALSSQNYPLDPNARVALPRWVGEGEGPLQEVMRGTSA